jgi:amino acid permease
MSEHTVHEPAAAGTQAAPVPRGRTSSGSLWLGWLYLGGMVMFMVGAFNAIEGLVALFNDEYYVQTPQGLLLFDITTWGWIHLIIGVAAIAVAIGVFAGAAWARICGVILCGINALTQLLFLSAYPAWAVLVIAFDILVIWALIVHGDEARE